MLADSMSQLAYQAAMAAAMRKQLIEYIEASCMLPSALDVDHAAFQETSF